MAVDLFESRPLSLLDVAKRPWRLNTNVLNSVLDQVEDSPVVIFSMNGATRTGKSFLLNYFVGFFETPGRPIDRFRWAGGQDRVTVGIDIWSKPYFVKTDDGQKVAVLLLDTQGLFDDKTRDSENALIFTVSSLLSSVMIYNHMEQINEKTLQHIHHVSTIARFFPIETPATSNANYPDLKNIFNWSLDQVQDSLQMKKLNSLLFLYRDAPKKTTYEYGLHSKSRPEKTGKKNYFQDFFETAIKDSTVPENRSSREGIKDNFENVAYYLLPCPWNGKDGENLTPTNEFTDEVESLLKTLKLPEYFVKKKLNGLRVVSGRELKDFVERLSRSIDMYSGEIEGRLGEDSGNNSSRSLEDCAAYFRCMYALDEAASHYAINLSKFLSNYPKGCSAKKLKSAGIALLKDSTEIFRSIAGILPKGSRNDLDFLGEKDGRLKTRTLRSNSYFEAMNKMASEKNQGLSWLTIVAGGVAIGAVLITFALKI